ncbi:MAG: allantoicase [Lysobacterales bacterium]
MSPPVGGGAPEAPGCAAPGFTLRYIDLAQPRLGARVAAVSDEFFAPCERLIDPAPPVFIAGKYDEHGKWMDGWESRRRRAPGHDWCVLKICAGVIHGADIDTSFFTGNYPPRASLEACLSETAPGPDTQWQELIPETALNPNAHHYLAVGDHRVFNHVRLNIFPDGGVARMRLYGVAHCDWSRFPRGGWQDLAAMAHGGRALSCNDMHFGHMSNLIAPGDGVNMGDGWETRRRREPGHDWVILKLGRPGIVRRARVDTAFFKGNYPARCALHGALLDLNDENVSAQGDYWQPLLPEVELGPDRKHDFEREIRDIGPISHVRFDIYPDGGVSRLRLLGDWLAE